MTHDVTIDVAGGIPTSGGGSLEVQDDGTAIETNTGVLDLLDGLSAQSPSNGAVEATLEATALKDGGTLEIDAAEFAAAMGAADTVLTSDGAAAAWSKVTNAALQNDSVTVTAGNALTGGGTPALGESVTLNVDESEILASELGGTVFDVGARDIEADGTTLWNESNNSLTARINTAFANVDELFLPDKGANPGTNGEITQNSNDVLIYSGGAIRNASNIGSGGGAPTDATYLTTEAEFGLSAETVVDAYPFTSSDLATDSVTDAEIAADSVGESELKSQVGGFEQISASGSYTASPGESVWADASSNDVPITLPSPSKSDEVRVIEDGLTASTSITLSENSSEGIQTPEGTVSTYTLTEGETVHVESNGTTWKVVGSLTSELDSGQLGTLATSLDSDDFTITNVASEETQGIAGVSVFPRTAINEAYEFNAVDWSREWRETAGELDVHVTVNWDTKPSVDLALDYIVWKGAGGPGGGSGGSADEAFDPVGPITSSTYTGTWDEVVAFDTSGGDITVTLPGTGSDGQFTAYKDVDANTLTIDTPGTESILNEPTPLEISGTGTGGTAYTFAVFPGDDNYRMI